MQNYPVSLTKNEPKGGDKTPTFSGVKIAQKQDAANEGVPWLCHFISKKTNPFESKRTTG